MGLRDFGIPILAKFFGVRQQPVVQICNRKDRRKIVRSSLTISNRWWRQAFQPFPDCINQRGYINRIIRFPEYTVCRAVLILDFAPTVCCGRDIKAGIFDSRFLTIRYNDPLFSHYYFVANA
jgi:hypothetical protein